MTHLVGGSYRDTSLEGFSSDAELVDGRPYYSNAGFALTPVLSRQRRYRDYDTKNLVVRGELGGRLETGLLTHHLLLGVDYDRYTLDTRQDRFRPGTGANSLTAASTQAQLYASHAINVFAPVYGDMPVPGAFTNQRERQRSWGVYLQDQIDLTDRLKLRLGGRYDHLAQRVDFRIPGTGGALPLPATLTKSRFSPQVGISYQIAQPVTVSGLARHAALPCSAPARCPAPS